MIFSMDFDVRLHPCSFQLGLTITKTTGYGWFVMLHLMFVTLDIDLLKSQD